MMKESNLLFRRVFIGLMTIAVALLLLPSIAQGQIGIDPCCAIISAGLKSISGLLTSVVAKPLSSIQQSDQQLAQFEQEVVWPAHAIDDAKRLVTQSQAQFSQMTSLTHLKIASASLPLPKSFEAALLSRDPVNVAGLGAQYQSVYGTPIALQSASPELRNASDMADAEAQAAMKKAIELDAVADLQLKAAEQINQRLQAAAPGTAEMLQTEVATWQLRGNAYSEQGMAELLRLRSIQLAGQGAQLKFSATHTTYVNGATGALTNESR